MKVKLLFFTFLLSQLFWVHAQQDALQYEVLKSKTESWFGVRTDSAFEYATKMLEVARFQNNHSRVGESLIFQGLAYGYLDDFQNEIIYYNKALAHGLKFADSLGIGKAHLNIGVNKFYRGLLDSAAISYEYARDIFERIGERKFLSFSLNNLGQVYSRIGNYEEASEAYQAALVLKMEAKDSTAILNTYFNLSSLYVSSKSYSKALEYSRYTLSLAEVLHDSVSIGGAWINIGVSLRKLDDQDQALAALASAEKYTPVFHKPSLLIDLYGTFTEIYLTRKDVKNARRYLRKMESVIREDAFLQTQMKFHELSYQINKMEGNDRAALASLEKHVEVKENYLSESVQKNIAELEKKYESEQKEHTIAELELDQKNAALALANSNNQRNLFISGFLLLVVLAGFMFYRFQVKKKTSDLLAIKNGQITEALEDRETLLKEIHHRVKNNLQIISSLLNLQAGSLEDEAAANAVKEGQHRVKSMALIHQKLYSTEDIRGVDVQDYFENLTKALFSAFGVQHIDYEVNTSGLKLDIDTVIPIGLIVNELITNAIKYAFANAKQGLLQINMSELDAKLQLTIQDSGEGMDEETMKTSNSFGWKMIRSLSRKLKAEINIVNDQGTTVHLILHKYKLVV